MILGKKKERLALEENCIKLEVSGVPADAEVKVKLLI